MFIIYTDMWTSEINRKLETHMEMVTKSSTTLLFMTKHLARIITLKFMNP